MATVLYSRGVFVNRCFDELNLSSPDLVRQVHREYAAAGAEPRVRTSSSPAPSAR